MVSTRGRTDDMKNNGMMMQHGYAWPQHTSDLLSHTIVTLAVHVILSKVVAK